MMSFTEDAIGTIWKEACVYYQNCNRDIILQISTELIVPTLVSVVDKVRENHPAQSLVGAFVRFFANFRSLPSSHSDLSDLKSRFVSLLEMLDSVVNSRYFSTFFDLVATGAKGLCAVAWYCANWVEELASNSAQSVQSLPQSPSKFVERTRTAMQSEFLLSPEENQRKEALIDALNKKAEVFFLIFESLTKFTVPVTPVAPSVEPLLQWVQSIASPPIDQLCVGCEHYYFEKWSDGLHCCDCGAIISDPERIKRELEIIDTIVDESRPEDGVNRGVTIQFLIDFANACNCWHLSTREVRRRFVMPATREPRCRFVELPEMVSAGVVGKAVTFVSHCWNGKFGDLVAAVADGAADRNRIVWVDIFAIRQWPANKPDLNFSDVVTRCHSFLIVCSSLSEVTAIDLKEAIGGLKTAAIPFAVRCSIAFFRVWCLVEVHAAITLGLNIVMKAGSYLHLESEFLFVSNADMLDKLMFFIDIRSADATVPSDKARILGDIEASRTGLDEVNQVVRSVIVGGSSGCRFPRLQCAVLGDSDACQEVIAHPFFYLNAVCACGYSALLRSLIQVHGVAILGNRDSTLTRAAAMGGHLENLKILIEQGCDIQTEDDNGVPPLIMALTGGHTACLKLLLQSGCNPNYINKQGVSALTFAAINSHASCVEVLLQAGCEASGALLMTIMSNSANTLEVLLRGGVSVNAFTSATKNITALMSAAQNGKLVSLQTLIKHGARLDDVDTVNYTALRYAIMNNHVACVAELLSAGCNVLKHSSVPDAARYGFKDCLSLLIQAGGDMNSHDQMGNPAIVLAAQFGHAECVKLLAERGADVNAVDIIKSSALSMAVCGGHTACVFELLKAGASTDVSDSTTQIMMAPNEPIIDMLVDVGFDVNYVREGDGYTPLINAARQGKLAALAPLLKHGAHIDAVDLQGHSALYHATLNKKQDCIDFLISRGSAPVTVTVTETVAVNPFADVLRLLTNFTTALQNEDTEGMVSAQSAFVNFAAANNFPVPGN